jgi:hypothetical protein
LAKLSHYRYDLSTYLKNNEIILTPCFLINRRSSIPIGREAMYYTPIHGRIRVFLGIGLH